MAIGDFDYLWPQGEQHPVLADWLENVQPLIAGLALRLPPEVRLDYSRQSMVELGEWVLARFPDEPSLDKTDDATLDLQIRITAYVGEALLLVGGGRWAYDDDERSMFYGRLVVLADDGAGIPTSPLSLLTAGVARRSNLFTKVHDVKRRRVAERRVAEPGWRPVREPTPGLTVVPEPDTAEHTAWVAAMDTELARFTAGLPSGTWDLSPASLDALGPVLLARPPDPAGDDDGAVRYVGEVMRRAFGGRWVTNDSPATPAGRRQVAVDGVVDRGVGRPGSAVANLRDKQDPGRLRFHLESYSRNVAGALGDDSRWLIPTT